MGEYAPSKCRSCGASIMWVKTSRGKNMPIDYDKDLEHEFTSVPGDRGPVKEAGRDRQGPTKPSWDPDRMTSHFETCPNAGDHRQ